MGVAVDNKQVTILNLVEGDSSDDVIVVEDQVCSQSFTIETV